jgi:hypothetical protein
MINFFFRLERETYFCTLQSELASPGRLGERFVTFICLASTASGGQVTFKK